MAELILFEDVEDLVRRYLATAMESIDPELAGVQVYAPPSPTTWPARSVLVRRTGGPTDAMVIDRAQVTLEGRGKTAAQAQAVTAYALALLARAERSGLMEDVPVYEVLTLSGPYLDPDPLQPGVPRYSATCQVAVRGRVIAAEA